MTKEEIKRKFEEFQAEAVKIIEHKSELIAELRSAVRLVQAGNKTKDKQIEQMSETIDALFAALRECEVEIDMAIDDEYPASAHGHFARQNAHWKANNPARIALDAYDAGRNK